MQSAHLCSFSPVWMIMCSKWPNDFLHSEQVGVFTPLWMSMCSWTPLLPGAQSSTVFVLMFLGAAPPPSIRIPMRNSCIHVSCFKTSEELWKLPVTSYLESQILMSVLSCPVLSSPLLSSPLLSRPPRPTWPPRPPWPPAHHDHHDFGDNDDHGNHEEVGSYIIYE